MLKSKYFKESKFVFQKTIEYRIMFILIITLIFGQRIAIPFGEFQIPLIFFVTYFCLLLLIVKGKLRFDLLKYLFFAIVCTFMFTIALFQRQYSPFSLFYFFVLYLPFVFYIKSEDPNLYKGMLFLFQKIMLVMAIIGLSQLILQLIGFPFTDLMQYLPEKIIQKGYNTSYPIYWGSDIWKPNGIFFLEPSFFSKFLGIAILIEFLYFKRIKYIFIFFSAILSSLSGTGLSIIILFGLPMIFKLGWKKTFWVLFTLFPFAIWFLATDYGAVIIQRINEFESTQSSAFIRFIAPFKVIYYLGNSYTHMYMFGLGAGTADDIQYSFQANYSVIPKLIIEYGLFVCFIFILFILWSLYRNYQSIVLSSAMLFMYLMLGGSLLEAQTVYLVYTLTILIPYRKTEEKLKNENKMEEYKKNSEGLGFTLKKCI